MSNSKVVSNSSKKDLTAIYNLKFYQKQKKWKFCRERELKKAKKDKTLNATYLVEHPVTQSLLNKAFLDTGPDSLDNSAKKHSGDSPKEQDCSQSLKLEQPLQEILDKSEKNWSKNFTDPSDLPEKSVPKESVPDKRLLRPALYWGTSEWPETIEPTEECVEINLEQIPEINHWTENWANLDWPDDKEAFAMEPHGMPDWSDEGQNLWLECEKATIFNKKIPVPDWPINVEQGHNGRHELWPSGKRPVLSPDHMCKCTERPDRDVWLKETKVWTNKGYDTDYWRNDPIENDPPLTEDWQLWTDCPKQLDWLLWPDCPRQLDWLDRSTQWIEFSRGAQHAPHSSEIELSLSQTSVGLGLQEPEAKELTTAMHQPPIFCDGSSYEEYPTRDVGLQQPSSGPMSTCGNKQRTTVDSFIRNSTVNCYLSKSGVGGCLFDNPTTGQFMSTIAVEDIVLAGSFENVNLDAKVDVDDIVDLKCTLDVPSNTGRGRGRLHLFENVRGRMNVFDRC